MKQIKTLFVCFILAGAIGGCAQTGNGTYGSHDVGEY